MQIAKRLQEKIELLREANDEIKRLKTTIKQQDDMIAAQASQINDLETQLTAYQQGGIVITENNGFISNAVEIPPYNSIVPYQEIPQITALYSTFPYLERDGNTISINEEQYKKYKGVI